MSQYPEEGEEKQKLSEKAAQTDSSYHSTSLHKISRARVRLLVCFSTLPVYCVAVWMLLANNRDTDTFMWIYFALYAIFAVDMALRKCPQCGEQFFVKNVLLNLFTKQCVHCGLEIQRRDGEQS